MTVFNGTVLDAKKSPSGSSAEPSSPTTTESGTNSLYDSESEYRLKLNSNSNYDVYRSAMEIALNISFLAATSNQLRSLISFRESKDFVASTVLVTCSLVIQIVIAILSVTIAVNDRHRWMKLKIFTTIAAIVLVLVNIIIPFVINAEHSHVDFSKIYSPYYVSKNYAL
ncbi:uncharacterized protein LOC129741552 [Uranotaenia lowii]|uniref:uncharacterized protein LOC129741552 n=1 Tax=Uranotaenia lowii TaxID=190385 RepID=UPI002478B9CA|nr:uncharacterized protein LOC129741552 [Uranotaenia lowii]